MANADQYQGETQHHAGQQAQQNNGIRQRRWLRLGHGFLEQAKGQALTDQVFADQELTDHALSVRTQLSLVGSCSRVSSSPSRISLVSPLLKRRPG